LTKPRILSNSNTSLHTNNPIIEDNYPIDKTPVNYNNDDIHRLIIAMELAQPIEEIAKNFGSTYIISGNTEIPNYIEVKQENISIKEDGKHVLTNYEKLQDLQKELYGDDPI
jgi:hypothetical protein